MKNRPKLNSHLLLPIPDFVSILPNFVLFKSFGVLILNALVISMEWGVTNAGVRSKDTAEV